MATGKRPNDETRQTRVRSQRQAFLKAFAISFNISEAAKLARMDRATHYLWLEKDTEYKEAFEAARQAAVDHLEAEAFRRAADGVEKPVYQGGQLVGTTTEHSDSLAQFLLRGLRPQVYRERHEITGAGGGPIEIADARTELVRRLDRLADQGAEAPTPEGTAEPGS